MKKKLSLVLALSMMLTLVPMSSFAASVNKATKVVKVQDDAKLGVDADLTKLRIKNDDGDWEAKEEVKLKLDNADFLTDSDLPGTGTDIAKWETVIEAVYDGNKKAGNVTVTKATDSRVEFTVTSLDGTTAIPADTYIIVPMYTEMDGEGTAIVKIQSDTNITESEEPFAKASSSVNVVTIDDTTTFGDKKEMEVITIEEKVQGSIDIDELEWIKLELDKNFDFADLNQIKVDGDFIKATANVVTTGTGTDGAPAANEIVVEYDGSDKDELKITFGSATLQNPSGVGDIEISGLYVDPTRNAKAGKVNLVVRANEEIDTTTLEIGEFTEFKVDVKADGDAKEIFAGRYEVKNGNTDYDDIKVNTADEIHELQTLIIDEKVEKTWSYDRSVVVELPEWVKIVSVETAGDEKELISDEKIDNNEYEFEMNKTGESLDTKQGKKEVKLTFFVSVEAGHEGDIEALVTGRGLDKEEFKAVLGKAISPVKVEAEVAKIKAGIRDQEIGKITITEAEAEAIQEGKDIVLELPDRDMEWDGEPTVKVTKGDLEIDDIDVDGNILTITIDDESTEASTIEITDGMVKLDRSIAEGGIDVEVKGSAIIQNGFVKDYEGDKNSVEEYLGLADVDKSDALDEYGIFTKDYVAQLEVANVITPADANVKGAEAAKFVIGNAEFMVGEKVMTADVAPYIKDGRTMLSLSFVAQAMGVDSKNIMWDGTTRTVTIFKGDRIAQVQIGSAKMMVNGTPVMMDTAAEIKDGRTMLPVSYVAKALGANVTWDGATRTVTIK